MGVGGTAMGSVAAAFRDAGYRVTGSDTGVYDPMKTFLEERGIEILEGYKAENLPDDADLFIVGNAQSRGNPEVEALLNSKAHIISMPELLKEQVLRGRRNFVVSGTHGKTTTASILAWIFESAGRHPNFLIGGLPGNFEQGARFCSDSDITVLEGDEYDTAFFDKRSKFVHYLPELAIVNNIEFDHADIYKDIDEIKKAFGYMVRLVPENGMVLLNGDDKDCADVYNSEGHSPCRWVGFGESCDVRIAKVQYGEQGTKFELDGLPYEIPLHGEFNVRNACMAITAASFGGVDVEAIRKALSDFSGVKRRQEVRGVTERGITVVDDFGHHPTAIREALDGLRFKYKGARLWAVFEPRSNTTRRNIFQDALPDALKHADAVCLAAVAKAEGLKPEERLDTDLVMKKLRASGNPAFYEPDVEAIVSRLKGEAKGGDVVVVFSNGGFGDIHEKLLAVL